MNISLHSYEHNEMKLWNRMLHLNPLRFKKYHKKVCRMYFVETEQYPPLPVDLTAAFECSVVVGAVEDHHHHHEEHHIGHHQHQDVDVEVQPNGQSAWRITTLIYSFTQDGGWIQFDGGNSSVVPTNAERRTDTVLPYQEEPLLTTIHHHFFGLINVLPRARCCFFTILIRETACEVRGVWEDGVFGLTVSTSITPWSRCKRNLFSPLKTTMIRSEGLFYTVKS